MIKKAILTLRHICRINRVMTFKDFKGRNIELSDESWLHICDFHPEITKADIANTLKDPEEVRQSINAASAELYYAIKAKGSKERFQCVVVKVLEDGFFVSTAMTTSGMKSGKTLYKKSKESL